MWKFTMFDRWTDGWRWMPNDRKSSHGFWSGELKIGLHKWTNLRARRPRPYFCRRQTDFVIFLYLLRCSQPLTCFCIIMPHCRNLSDLSFSRYATCPALKNILVLPNLYLSGSCQRAKHSNLLKHLSENSVYNIYFQTKKQKKIRKHTIKAYLDW